MSLVTCRAGMKSTNTSPPSSTPQSSLGYVLSRETVPLTVSRGVPGLPSLQIQPVLGHGYHAPCALEDCLGPAGVPLLVGSVQHHPEPESCSGQRSRGPAAQRRGVDGGRGRLPSGTVGGAVSHSLQKGHADPLVWMLCIHGLAVGGWQSVSVVIPEVHGVGCGATRRGRKRGALGSGVVRKERGQASPAPQGPALPAPLKGQPFPHSCSQTLISRSPGHLIIAFTHPHPGAAPGTHRTGIRAKHGQAAVSECGVLAQQEGKSLDLTGHIHV